MIGAPAAAMLESKFFVTRFDLPRPKLFERFWDGKEWVWIDHGYPGNVGLASDPGAAMMNSKLFVTLTDGSLAERVWNGTQWVWNDHGRPSGAQLETAPGAAMMNSKFFVGSTDGRLFERVWSGTQWNWVDHGRPPGTGVATAPGAAMLNSKLFVGSSDARLFERYWTDTQWVWVDHGRPSGTGVATAPGAAMLGSKLFVGTTDGRLAERYWTGTQWVWVDHGRPAGTDIVTAPGAAIANREVYVGSADGRLFARRWTGTQWLWDHFVLPPDAEVGTSPGVAILGNRVFAGSRDGRLFDCTWADGPRTWINHGVPFADQAQHVVDNRARGPRPTILVLGDGFAPVDMPEYRRYVNDEIVNKVFRGTDVLSSFQSAFNVVRADIASVESGVTELRFDERGTPDVNTDDVLKSRVDRSSRLGFINTGSWANGWIKLGDATISAIDRLKARFAPDATNVVVVVNSMTRGGVKYGGVPLCAFTIRSPWSTIAHELGHEVFGLADEYVQGTRTWSRASDGLWIWGPNCTDATTRAEIPWEGLIAPSTPTPTNPTQLPSGWDWATSVGQFEGGGGRFRFGLFRPVLSCRMNRNNPPWCPVCASAMMNFLSMFP